MYNYRRPDAFNIGDKMRTIVITGTTGAVISLNKIGGYIRGKEPTFLIIDTPDKERELEGLIKSGLVKEETQSLAKTVDTPKETEQPKITDKLEHPKQENVVSDPNVSFVVPEFKPTENKTSDAKKSKVKRASSSVVETNLDGDVKSEKMGSRVVVSTGSGVKEGRMKYSSIDESVDSDRTKASIEAMKKLEDEEKNGKGRIKTIIDESKLDASEQAGRKAVISNEGKADIANMENSILPNSKEIKDRDPFIETEDNEDNDDIFIDKSEKKPAEFDDDDFIQL